MKETARLISELSWSEYSLVEDAFGDPSTPMAKRSIDFHNPLPSQLEKIMHEIRVGIYHEDSGTHSDMESLSSETDVKMMKEEEPDEQMADDFRFEVGGFAISCGGLDDKINTKKKSDYMYEIGTKHEFFDEMQLVEMDVTSKHVDDEVKASEDADGTQKAAPLPPPAPATQPTARPRSAPTFSSLQQRRSSHIQLKSFSTTTLPSHQPVAAAASPEKIKNYKSFSMNNQFPKWLYSEVVKVGMQFSKPGFLRSHSSSSLSSTCSDPESTMDDEDSTATDSSSNQQVMQTEEVAVNGGTTYSGNTSAASSTAEDNRRDTEQFDHYEAICYLWRGM